MTYGEDTEIKSRSLEPINLPKIEILSLEAGRKAGVVSHQVE
jgi:hypothetical protein